MRSPLSTNELPPDLAARFAALRAPARSPESAAIPRSPTSAARSDQEPDSQSALERRLEELSTPTKGQVERGVKVEMKGVTSPDKVERYLAQLQSEELHPGGVDEIDFPSPPPHDRSPPSARARQHIPTLSPSLLDTLSGVEVQFFRPSLGASTGDLDSGPRSGFEPGSQEDDLLRRLRDELKLEANVRARDEESAAGWDDRLNKLKEFKSPTGTASTTSGAGALSRSEIGAPPDLGDLEREVKRRQKREAKKGGTARRTDSDSDSDSNSDETDSSSEKEEESESDDADATGTP